MTCSCYGEWRLKLQRASVNPSGWVRESVEKKSEELSESVDYNIFSVSFLTKSSNFPGKLTRWQLGQHVLQPL